MGLFDRFLHRDDSKKAMRDYVRKLEDEIGKIKAETASIDAEEKRLKRALDECIQDIKKMEKYAMRAEEAGNDADAQKFRDQVDKLASQRERLENEYQYVADKAKKLRAVRDKLADDMKEIDAMRKEDRW